MKWVKYFLSVIFLASILFGEVALCDALTVQNRSPSKNTIVDSVEILLRVNIYEGDDPKQNIWVHFYLDGEHIGVEFTDNDGLAYMIIDEPIEHGQHKWKVRYEKGNLHPSYWSDEWSFNYQPKPVLTLISKYGETFGGGKHPFGKSAYFGVTSLVDQVEEGTRYVFTGWISYQEDGYTGSDPTHNITLYNDVYERAEWRKEYFVDIDSDLPRFVYPKSGWFPEGTVIKIRAEPPDGTSFLNWTGTGIGSYSGNETSHRIVVNSSIREEAVFKRENYTLEVESQVGDVFGTGSYAAWDNVTLGISDELVQVDNFTRYKFTGWKNEPDSTYLGNSTSMTIELNNNITIRANWIKQCYVTIMGNDGGYHNNASQWLDEKTYLKLWSQTKEGYVFSGWIGEGDSSYSGPKNNYTLLINSPINETAIWKRICDVEINSELPTIGQGEYLEGEKVTLQAEKSEGLLVRRVFKEWKGDIYTDENPFTFTIHKDMSIQAEYQKDYTYFIVVIVSAILALGVWLFKMLRKKY